MSMPNEKFEHLDNMEDRGWEAMQLLLDEHMPVKRKKRIFAWYWLAAAVTLLLVGLFYWSDFQDTAEELGSLAKDDPLGQDISTPLAEVTGQSTEPDGDSDVSMLEAALTSSDVDGPRIGGETQHRTGRQIDPVSENHYPEMAGSIGTTGNSTRVSAYHVSGKDEKFDYVISDSSTSQTVRTASGVGKVALAEVDQSAPHKQREVDNLSLLPAMNGIVLFDGFEEVGKDIAIYDLIDGSSRLSGGFYAGANITYSLGSERFGWDVGLTKEFALSKRWFVSVGTHFGQLSAKQRFLYSTDNLSAPDLEVFSLDQVNVSSNLDLLQTSITINKINQLKLPLGLSYSIASRWRLRFSYVYIRHWEAESGTLLEFSSVNPSFTDRISTDEILARQSHLLGGGGMYYISNRLSAQIDYYLPLTSHLKYTVGSGSGLGRKANRLQEHLQVGLRYRF